MNVPAAAELLFRPEASLPRGATLALTALRWLLAAFFVFLALKNLAGDATMARDFERWGFPGWFRAATAVAQIAGALLLLDVRGTFWGGALLGGVLVGAAVTHLRYDPPAAAISPLVVLAPIAILAIAYRPPFLR